MSAVSSHAAIQAAAGCARPVPPGVRRLQLRPLLLEGRQLGGAGASLEEPLQKEEQEGGTEAGEEAEEEEEGKEKGRCIRFRSTERSDVSGDISHHLAKCSPSNL